MTHRLPKILLVTDAPFSEPACGIDRTLQNLFSLYPAEQLRILAPESIVRARPPRAEYRARVRTFRDRLTPWNKSLRGFAGWMRRSLLQAIPRRAEDVDSGFAPEVLMICSSMAETSIVAAQIARGFNGPVIYYAMDDLRGMESQRWFRGTGSGLLRELLERADAWMMISEALALEYEERYGIVGKRRAIVHNPVPRDSVRAGGSPSKSPHRIAYAGSAWAMHLDALFAIANAIRTLRAEGLAVELVLYMGREFWEAHRREWERCEAKNGGLLPYDELLERLGDAAYLLACVSFEKQYHHLARTSVQTKLTDYMAAGRPVLVCGPSDSACAKFVEQWNCGFVISATDNETIAQQLRRALEDHDAASAAAECGRAAVLEHFSCDAAHTKLSSLLLELTLPAAQRGCTASEEARL